jgi:spore coat protein U-like protein
MTVLTLFVFSIDYKKYNNNKERNMKRFPLSFSLSHSYHSDELKKLNILTLLTSKIKNKIVFTTVSLLSFLSLLSLSYSAFAGSVNATTKASATLAATCTLGTGSLNFGVYNPNSSSNTVASTTISFICTKGVSATINLNDSVVDYNNQTPSKVSNGASYPETNGVQWARYMSGSTENGTLSYNLFQDASLTKIFGGQDWFAEITNHNVTMIATGSNQTVPVYGVIASGQYVQPDTYIDIVPVVLSF